MHLKLSSNSQKIIIRKLTFLFEIYLHNVEMMFLFLIVLWCQTTFVKNGIVKYQENFFLCDTTDKIIIDNNNEYDNEYSTHSLIISESGQTADDGEYIVYRSGKNSLVVFRRNQILYETSCIIVSGILVDDQPYEKVSN